MAKLKRYDPSQTRQLFSRAARFHLVELRASDVHKETDNLRVFKELIVSNEAMYSNIKSWLETKVLPGLKSAERNAYVAFEDEKPIASAVMKRGERAKFCHLRIHRDFQDMDLGQMFFTIMTLEARHLA